MSDIDNRDKDHEQDAEGQDLEIQNLISELSKLGYYYVREDRLDEAEEKFNKILEYDPENTYALVGLGDVARKKNHHEEAVRHYSECLRLYDDNNYALFGLADSYKALRKYEKAIEIWERYLEKDDKNITVLTRIADAYKKVKNFDKSREVYLRALEVEEDNPYALIGLGYLNFDFKFYKDAQHYWEKVLDIPGQEDNIKILTALGNCCRKLKTFEKGLEFFEKALAIEDDNFYALFGMADCYRGIKDQEKSLEYWLRILAADPENKVILTRAGDTFRNLGQLEKAEEYYRKALNVGFDTYAVLGLAIISKMRGNYEEALKSLHKLISNDTNNPRLFLEAAECYLAIHRKDKAIDVLTEFTKGGHRNIYISEMLIKLKK
jgi:tetratricopeptide (TPR) repeat protein